MTISGLRPPSTWDSRVSVALEIRRISSFFSLFIFFFFCCCCCCFFFLFLFFSFIFLYFFWKIKQKWKREREREREREKINVACVSLASWGPSMAGPDSAPHGTWGPRIRTRTLSYIAYRFFFPSPFLFHFNFILFFLPISVEFFFPSVFFYL